MRDVEIYNRAIAGESYHSIADGKGLSDAQGGAFDASVDHLCLKVRAANVLKNSGLAKVGDVVSCSDAFLLSLPGSGKVSVTEIRAAVNTHLVAYGVVPSSSDEETREFLEWCLRNRGILQKIKIGLIP